MENQKNNFGVPVAIVIAGMLIAGAVYFGAPGGSVATPPPPQAGAVNADGLEKMNPITSADHLRGNADAPVKIVEYSDTECPFCKRFHDTMEQIMDEYGKDGKVAWVYRQFPLVQLHLRATKEAEATECANELGGPDKFWAYLDRLFAVTPSNDGLDPAQLPTIAQFTGLDVSKFNSCLDSGKYVKHIEEDTKNAVATGGNGTPWSIIIAKNGKKYSLSGAQPYEAVKQLVELALQEK